MRRCEITQLIMTSILTLGSLVADKAYTFAARENSTVEHALGQMRIYDIVALPIYDESERLLGMLTVQDILDHLMHHEKIEGMADRMRDTAEVVLRSDSAPPLISHSTEY